MKMHSQNSSAKWRPFGPAGYELNMIYLASHNVCVPCVIYNELPHCKYTAKVEIPCKSTAFCYVVLNNVYVPQMDSLALLAKEH